MLSFIGAAILAVATGTAAAPPVEDPSATEVLQVATRHVPPFAERDAQGEWRGTSIELWRDVAAALGLRYELREVTLDEMIAGLQDGRYDAAVAALTVTAERERVIDFSHPYQTSGLGIAVARSDSPLWLAIARTLWTWSTVQLVMALALLQLLAGIGVWWAEGRKNPQFAGSTARGIGTGYWWAVVTMTTVGYGDKVPVTVAGRAVALVWMLFSVVMLTTFTASVASTLTLHRLESRIRGPGDLDRVRVGVVASTTSEAYARGSQLDFVRYSDLDAGLSGVAAGEIAVFLYDAPMLDARIAAHWSDRLERLPVQFQRQDYAIGLPEHSPLLERINRVLPELVRDTDVYAERRPAT